jgi:hypothetical protein
VTLSAEGCRKALAALRRQDSGAAANSGAERVPEEAIFGRLRCRRICKLTPPQVQYLHTADVRRIHNYGKGKARLSRYDVSTQHRVIELVTIRSLVTASEYTWNQLRVDHFESGKSSCVVVV